MQTPDSSNSDDANVESASKNAAATEEEKLLREIKELECIVKQCEWNLQTLRFKDVEERATERFLQSSGKSSHHGKTPNVEFDLQNDLYRFAGFHCVKFRRDELIFNFTSTNEEQKDNTYAIQIFMKNGKCNLGKWVMPMMIDMKYILSKTPIDDLKNLTAFIKNCKRNVDCYTARKEQFLSLKKHISHIKHCTLQSDIGFTQINLELYGVHDSESDKCINLIIYLLYHPDKARPYKIEVDTTDKNKLSDDIKHRLKLHLKKFKISDLQTAFDKILTEDNSAFTWMQADDSESPLELNDTNSSDEDFLTQLQSNRKRPLRKLQKRRELQKKWNERKRQRPISKNTESSSEDNMKDGHSKTKISCTESPQQILIRKKKAEKAISVSKQEKINKNTLEETTPVHKTRVKLKQTKLNFQINEARHSNANEISLFKSKLRNRFDSKQTNMTKLITSTPLNCRIDIRKVPVSPTLEINNITFIKTSKKMADKLDDSRNSNQLKNKKTEKTTQRRSDRILRSNTKTTGL